MTRVELHVRHLLAREAFRAGTFEARLDEVDANGLLTGGVTFTTRGHETWSGAARAALKKADKMAWDVGHRSMILRRIEAEDAETRRIEEAEEATRVRYREKVKEIKAPQPPLKPFDEARAAAAWRMKKP